MPATFLLSAFGDEIDDDLTTQLDVLDSEGITALELRSTWGVNVLDLSGDQLRRVRELLHERGFQVSAIGSPIGKSSLSEPRTFEQERLERALTVAERLDIRLIRIFSFYPRSACLLARIILFCVRRSRAGAYRTALPFKKLQSSYL